MENNKVPEVLTGFQQLNAGEFSFVYYQEASPSGRNLFSFSCCAVSFILSGQKEFYGGTDATRVNDHEGIFIPGGNAVMAEHKFGAAQYGSLVIFFPTKMAKDFIAGHFPGRVINGSSHPESFFKLTKTPYITNYINGLLLLIDKRIAVPKELLQHKLDELFLILAHSCPAAFLAAFRSGPPVSEDRLKQTVENNLLNNLTLTELAFLCNRSLASFKRDFEKAYGISPGKYIRERKLDIARRELMNGDAPNKLYLQLGYDNVSNFAGAFKKRFGQTPKIYRLQQKLN
jgi:AraC-like DNA-binding protein